VNAVLPDLRRVTPGGRTLAYREVGPSGLSGVGQPLVLLHGIGSGSGSWRHQFQEFGRKFRVIAWDAPGYGGSDPLPAEAPTPADYADAVLELVDALELRRFVLLGHSLGGAIAAAFARRYGDRLNALILTNPTPGYATASEDIRWARVDTRIKEMKELGPEGLAARRAPGLLSANAPAEAVEAVRAIQRQLRPDGYAQAARMLGLADTAADGAFIKVPTLVMGASNDTMTPDDVVKRVAAAIPGARFVSLAGPGHASYVEDPGAFNATVLSFVGAHA
jgi:pimeloyl-ACP methyl ester carboxylesterase